MRNKTLLFATTAVALLSGAGQAQAEGMYISVLGGLNWQHDQSGSQSTSTGRYFTNTSFAEQADTGFVLGGAVGTHMDKWVQGLRAEVEVSYRRNDHNGVWANTITTTTGRGNFLDSQTEAGVITGNTSNFAIMANVWYDVEMGWKAKPYIGGGVGWARAHLDAAVATTTFTDCCDLPNDRFFNQDHNGFAWQLGAGFNYEVAPGVDLGLGYRYFRGPSFDPIFIGKNNLADGIDNDNHSVAASLTININ